MREVIHFTDLGATLFVPATHKDLQSIIEGKKYLNLKSVVIDTEDGINADSLSDALVVLKNLLVHHTQEKLLVFIRPKNVEVFKEILSYKNISSVDGFVLPKFSLSNADAYLKLIAETKFYFMPSIEGVELFNSDALRELKNKLGAHQQKIILVRFGLEDMLRQLAMKRECQDSVFDISVTNAVLGNFLAIFKSANYAVSGGVYPCFKDNAGFIKDVKRDLKEGLFSKTIIHPSQIDALHELYKVTAQEYSDAQKLLQNRESIINLNGKMGEGKTMSPYAQLIVKRAEVYGVI